MSGSQIKPRFSLRSPALVNITIVGHLDDSWSEQLGLRLEKTTIPDDTAVTVLSGKVLDQAALFGVLNGLYGLGFPLMSVECTPLA